MNIRLWLPISIGGIVQGIALAWLGVPSGHVIIANTSAIIVGSIATIVLHKV